LLRKLWEVAVGAREGRMEREGEAVSVRLGKLQRIPREEKKLLEASMK